MVKILKNSTGSIVNITDIGFSIPASGQITIDASDYDKIATSSQLPSLVTAGTIVINDGVNDLSVTDGNNYILLGTIAKGIRFDNISNGFTSKNVQSAIEEARTTAEGKARFAIGSGFDGTANVGRYFEFVSNVDSNQSPWVAPRAIILKEITLSVAANATTTITVYKNGSALETISLSASRTTVKSVSHSFASLDQIQIATTSGSSSRPNLFLYFQVE